MFYEKVQADGLVLTGCCQAMFSNRLSYWLGTNGKLKFGHNNLQFFSFIIPVVFTYILIYVNTTGMMNLKIINASQGHIQQYENTRRKLHDCIANIYFN
jgi:hypothetical protein